MSYKIKKPELLAPAGDMERLMAAVKYGADAVYLGGKVFGMRAAPSNFGEEELPKAVTYCHERGVKVYLTCNVLPRNDELAELPDFLLKAEKAGVDALIISDIGVLEYAKKYVPDMEIHISTQTSIVSPASAKAWAAMGAKRLVLARELTMDEIRAIRAELPEEIELEAFMHGSMCVSYSGRCMLSHHIIGRDANRGACAQPCRWGYYVVEEKRPDKPLPVEEDGQIPASGEDNGSQDAAQAQHRAEGNLGLKLGVENLSGNGCAAADHTDHHIIGHPALFHTQLEHKGHGNGGGEQEYHPEHPQQHQVAFQLEGTIHDHPQGLHQGSEQEHGALNQRRQQVLGGNHHIPADGKGAAVDIPVAPLVIGQQIHRQHGADQARVEYHEEIFAAAEGQRLHG